MIRPVAVAALLTLSFPAFAAEDSPPPSPSPARTLAETVCVACHGLDGNSPSPANPHIAGQGYDYLLKQLREFKNEAGRPALRENPVMGGMTAGLSGDDMKALARYFSQQKLMPSAAADATLAAAGKVLWRRGDFERGIPACAGCHGPNGAGIPPQYPRLAGQYAEYTESQLKNFRAETRSNDPERMMRSIADRLSDKQIKALADYIAGLR